MLFYRFYRIGFDSLVRRQIAGQEVYHNSIKRSVTSSVKRDSDPNIFQPLDDTNLTWEEATASVIKVGDQVLAFADNPAKAVRGEVVGVSGQGQPTEGTPPRIGSIALRLKGQTATSIVPTGNFNAARYGAIDSWFSHLPPNRPVHYRFFRAMPHAIDS